MKKEEKDEMDKIIKKYLKKVVLENPFKTKILLHYFKRINIEKSLANFIYSISTLDYLVEFVEKKYFPFEQKNNAYIAKNIYEECISISVENLFLNDEQKREEIFLKLGVPFKIKFIDIIKKCKEKILLISVKFLPGTDFTKKTGKLYENIKNLDFENLSLISVSLSENLKNFEKYENKNELEQNKEILELGSIGYANFVKIELLRNKNKLDVQKLLNYANKSIEMAEKVGENIINKKWYKEILKLKKEIEKKLTEIPKEIPLKKDFQKIREKIKFMFDIGNKELIEYLLKNYPIEKYKYSEETLKEFTEDEKQFLKSLKTAYKKATKFLKDLNEDENNINENYNEISQIIIEYINNMINRLKNQ